MQENFQELQLAASRISRGSDLSDELLHHCLEAFLIKKDVNTIVASGGARFYLVRMMMSQWNSSSSPFYFKYKRSHEEITEDYIDPVEEEDDGQLEKTADKIREELDHLTWYDKMLFDTFVQENHTVSSLARATQLPRTSISLSINRIRRHIKTKLDPNQNDETNQMEV